MRSEGYCSCVCVCVCVSVHGSNLLVAQLCNKLVILTGSVSWSLQEFGVFRIMACVCVCVCVCVCPCPHLCVPINNVRTVYVHVYSVLYLEYTYVYNASLYVLHGSLYYRYRCRSHHILERCTTHIHTAATVPVVWWLPLSLAL